MKQELITKYLLGELTLKEVLYGIAGVAGIKMTNHELPAVRTRKNKKNLLIFMDSVQREADFVIPLNSKVKKIVDNKVEIVLDGLGRFENAIYTIILETNVNLTCDE